MATMNYSDSTISAWTDKFQDMVKDAEKMKEIVPHFGTDNNKTHAVNEGTLPIITCDKCAVAPGGCAHSCYAFRVCMYSPMGVRLYALNTVCRRRDPRKYYRTAFATAYAAGALLRLNESGDFENIKQFNAACLAAKEFSTVKCIAYTHRRNIGTLNHSTPKNFVCRYSAWTDAENLAWRRKTICHSAPLPPIPRPPKALNSAPLSCAKRKTNGVLKPDLTRCPNGAVQRAPPPVSGAWARKISYSNYTENQPTPQTLKGNTNHDIRRNDGLHRQ